MSCLQFPATACKDSSSASLIVRNTSSDCSSVFEFGVPLGSHIKVGWGLALLHFLGGDIAAAFCLAAHGDVLVPCACQQSSQ